MSVETRIRCDGKPGGEGTKCLETAGAILLWHTNATKIRRFWTKHGWHRTRDGRDICPKCWADNVHKGQISPNWCTECDERRPCGCDSGRWSPLPGETWADEDDGTGPEFGPEAAA